MSPVSDRNGFQPAGSHKGADRFDSMHSPAGLQALEAKYKRLFDASQVMQFVVSRTGRLLDINASGVRLFGFENKEQMLELESVASLYADPEDGTLLNKRLEEDGYVKGFEIEMKRRNGSCFVASITANLWFEEDGSVSYEGLLLDVTECRQWKNALIEAERHNRELSESEQRIRALNQHILQMLMIMAHDIRGPLVSVAATLKLLIRGSYGRMDESVANTVKDLLSRVAQLLGIAEDCLGKANSVEGSIKVEREILDLRQDIIDPVLDELSNEIQHLCITIDNRLGAIPAGSIPVNVNAIWLKAVFRNLFKNAVKYGGRGCTIAFGFEDHGSHYRLNVYNSGTPVPEEHRDKLFTRFGRISPQGKRSTDGIGMGLYLIKEIIRRHGGDIWYQATPEGSDFIFTIAKECGC